MEHKELHEGFHRVGENDETNIKKEQRLYIYCLLYTSPSPRD